MNTRKDWMLVFGIYTIALSFLNILFVRSTTFDEGDYHDVVAKHGVAYMEDAYPILIKGIAVFDIIFFGIGMLFCASFLFYHLKKKPWCSAYLMWPASNLEKYLVSLVLNVVMAAIGTIICVIIADALRVLVDALSGRIVVWAIPMIFDLKTLNLNPLIACGPFLSEILLIHAAYILGGTLFRKQQFVLTTIAIVIIGYIMVFTWHSPVIDNANLFDLDEKGKSVPNAWFYVVSIGGYLLTALCYWLSYKIFCRMQVINNKWLNV
jgi:hypothetical protein